MIQLGHGIGLDRRSAFGIDIPTTGPDSYGDGESLVSWLDPDFGVTLSGSDLASIQDRAALAEDAIWTPQFVMDPSSDLNGTNRWNVNETDQWLSRSDGGALCSAGYVAAFYIRMFTSSGDDRVPWGIDSTDREDGLGAISLDYLADDVLVGDGVSANADVIGGASMTNNTSYVIIATYNRTTGEMRCYKDAVDITEVTPHTLATGLNFIFNYAWGVGKSNSGLYNAGHQLLYNAVPTLALVNQAGQFISDEYGLGQTWALS